MRRIHEEGHAIGGHSYDHPDFRDLSVQDAYKSQIENTQNYIKDIVGYAPSIFRPPYGALTDDQVSFLCQKKLKMINWSIDTFDWDAEQNSVQEILQKVSEYKHPGAIILMHSGGGNRSNTVQALPLMIEHLREAGYGFSTIPALLNIPLYSDKHSSE